MEVDITDVLNWIKSIDYVDWPQQPRIDKDKIRPAMVNDPNWFRFYKNTDNLVKQIMWQFPNHHDCNRMLSVVMPGASIEPHKDLQIKEWVTRIHVPLMTNPEALFYIAGDYVHMEVGKAYLIDTEAEHGVVNTGNCERIHFMFDVISESYSVR